MKVENYSYDTFPSYDQDIEGIIELKGKKDNLRCRMKDVEYQEGCIIRFLFPNTILDGNRKYPLVVHVQGSGWYKQDMADHIFDFMPIVKSGIAYAIVQYRHSPQYHFPTQIIDTKKAIRFIERHADDYPIDINQLFLSGDSSGGHTALMTLFTYNQGLFDQEKSLLPPLKLFFNICFKFFILFLNPSFLLFTPNLYLLISPVSTTSYSYLFNFFIVDLQIKLYTYYQIKKATNL